MYSLRNDTTERRLPLYVTGPRAAPRSGLQHGVYLNKRVLLTIYKARHKLHHFNTTWCQKLPT